MAGSAKRDFKTCKQDRKEKGSTTSLKEPSCCTPVQRPRFNRGVPLCHVVSKLYFCLTPSLTGRAEARVHDCVRPLSPRFDRLLESFQSSWWLGRYANSVPSLLAP